MPNDYLFIYVNNYIINTGDCLLQHHQQSNLRGSSYARRK